jgi:hypothetical protein
MSPLRDTIKPIYILAFLLGVTPFLWRRPPWKKLHETILVATITLFHTAVCLRELIGVRARFLRFPFWTLDTYLYFWILLTCSFSNLILLFVGFIRRRGMHDTLQRLEDVDERLATLGVRVNHSREQRICYFVTITGNASFAMYIFFAGIIHITKFKFKDPWTTALSLYIHYIYCTIFSLYAAVMQRTVLLRFRALNDVLKNYFLRNQEIETDDKEDYLISLAILHGKLEICYRSLSDSFGIQVRD